MDDNLMKIYKKGDVNKTIEYLNKNYTNTLTKTIFSLKDDDLNFTIIKECVFENKQYFTLDLAVYYIKQNSFEMFNKILDFLEEDTDKKLYEYCFNKDVKYIKALTDKYPPCRKTLSFLLNKSIDDRNSTIFKHALNLSKGSLTKLMKRYIEKGDSYIKFLIKNINDINNLTSLFISLPSDQCKPIINKLKTLKLDSNQCFISSIKNKKYEHVKLMLENNLIEDVHEYNDYIFEDYDETMFDIFGLYNDVIINYAINNDADALMEIKNKKLNVKTYINLEKITYDTLNVLFALFENFHEFVRCNINSFVNSEDETVRQLIKKVYFI